MNQRVVDVVERANALCLQMRVARLEAQVRVCKCGKPARPNRREAICYSCDEDAFDARNRARPAAEQRD